MRLTHTGHGKTDHTTTVPDEETLKPRGEQEAQSSHRSTQAAKCSPSHLDKGTSRHNAHERWAHRPLNMFCSYAHYTVRQTAVI